MLLTTLTPASPQLRWMMCIAELVLCPPGKPPWLLDCMHMHPLTRLHQLCIMLWPRQVTGLQVITLILRHLQRLMQCNPARA